ncbi:MAG: hypothetical protein ABI725_01005 [Chloroflexota bacterium]
MQPIDREAVLVEPEAVAQLIADPARRMDGVIALVAGLGIGIYTSDGRQILPGSETSQDDFLLYDFEVPVLARMAAGEPEPFSNLYGILTAAGYSGSSLELAIAFSSAFAAAPDSFMTRLFVAMGVTTDQPTLTPLQSWLLLLTAAPLNGTHLTAAIARLAAVPQTAVCGGTITASGVKPNWAVGPNPALDELAFASAVDLYYALQGPLLERAIDFQVVAMPSSVHEGHGGPGESAEFLAHLEVDFIPQEVLSGGCGTLINSIRPVFGPVAGVPVTWELLPGIDDHGYTTQTQSDAVTGANGIATLRFTAQTEASAGQGPEHSIVGNVFAFVPTRDLFERFLGINDPRLLRFLGNLYPAAGHLTVTWHAPDETPSPSPRPPNVPDPCSLITQEEAAAAADKDVRPGFVVDTTIETLGSGLACVFRDADAPSGVYGIAHIRIDVVDLGAAGGSAFTAAGRLIGNGVVPGLGDENFYSCPLTCAQAFVYVRRGHIAVVISDLAGGDALTGATTLARLALGRLTRP